MADYNRGNLKYDIKNYRGALIDYNRAIALNPEYAAAYSNRGSLKADAFNDRQGGIQDLQQAAVLAKAQSLDRVSEIVRTKLKSLGINY